MCGQKIGGYQKEGLFRLNQFTRYSAVVGSICILQSPHESIIGWILNSRSHLIFVFFKIEHLKSAEAGTNKRSRILPLLLLRAQ
jgi:hypothetical protein